MIPARFLFLSITPGIWLLVMQCLFAICLKQIDGVSIGLVYQLARTLLQVASLSSAVHSERQFIKFSSDISSQVLVPQLSE